MIICSDPSTFTGNPLIEASERLACKVAFEFKRITGYSSKARCYPRKVSRSPWPWWLGRYFSFYILELGTSQAVSSPEKSEGDVLQSNHQSLNFRKPGRSRWLFVPKFSMNRINGDGDYDMSEVFMSIHKYCGRFFNLFSLWISWELFIARLRTVSFF